MKKVDLNLPKIVDISRRCADSLLADGQGRVFLNRGVNFPYIFPNSALVFRVPNEKHEIQKHLFFVKARNFYGNHQQGLFEVEVKKATIEEMYAYRSSLLAHALCEVEIC